MPRPGDPLIKALVVIGVFCLLMALILWGWDNMTPWGTKAKLNSTAAELTQTVDDRDTLKAQAAQDTAIGTSRQDTYIHIRHEEARANAAIREIEAADSPDDKRLALYGFLCGSPVYAADPECAGYADPE